MTLAKHKLNSLTPSLRRLVLRRGAFSMIEVLIAVTLMSVIVLGLMAMFGETQRAFRTGITQSDVMESGRATIEMMAREIEQADATDMPGAVNFNIGPNPFVGFPAYGNSPASLRPYELIQALPNSIASNAKRTNILQDVLFLTRSGQQWKAIGYAVAYTDYMGTLYRYETNASVLDPDWQYLASTAFNTFFSANPTNVSPGRVVDGVVNLRVRTYDNFGRLISPDYNYLSYPQVPTLNTNLVYPSWGGRGPDDISTMFRSNALPAYVEIELGILEAKTAERARAMPLDAQLRYLSNHVGQVQVFRQRIPIRNSDPSVYQ